MNSPKKVSMYVKYSNYGNLLEVFKDFLKSSIYKFEEIKYVKSIPFKKKKLFSDNNSNKILKLIFDIKEDIGYTNLVYTQSNLVKMMNLKETGLENNFIELNKGKLNFYFISEDYDLIKNFKSNIKKMIK